MARDRLHALKEVGCRTLTCTATKQDKRKARRRYRKLKRKIQTTWEPDQWDVCYYAARKTKEKQISDLRVHVKAGVEIYYRHYTHCFDSKVEVVEVLRIKPYSSQVLIRLPNGEIKKVNYKQLWTNIYRPL